MNVSKIGVTTTIANRATNKVGNKNLSKPSFKSDYWPGWQNVEDAAYALEKYSKRNLEECSCEELKNCINNLHSVAMGHTFAPGSMNRDSAILFRQAQRVLEKKEALKKALKL